MQRNLNADILKSISIFGVVFIHASSIFGEFDIMLFFRDMFRFAVPCFIILWAFFFEKSYDKKSEEQRLKYIYYRSFSVFIDLSLNSFDLSYKVFKGVGHNISCYNLYGLGLLLRRFTRTPQKVRVSTVLFLVALCLFGYHLD